MKHTTLLSFFTLIFSFSFSQNDQKSIHHEQSEHYSKYNFTDEKDWDALRIAESGIAPELMRPESSKACTLNKRVYGWNPYWMGSSYLNYDWELLTDLCHFSYEVDVNTGNAITTHGWLTDAAVTAAKNNGVKVSLCVTMFGSHATFLTNATSKQTFITSIISQVQQRNGSGCNIDFEGVPLAQSANFTAFMIDLCNQMHAAIPGSEISIALPAVDWSNVYDVNAMANYVDLFIIMGYDYYWSGSTTAGPTDPLFNFVTSYNYTLPKSITFYLNKNVPKAKLLLGLPYYGREWPTNASTIPATATATGTARTYNFVRNNASGNYSNPQWDPNSFSQYFPFNISGWNQCFINNGYSMGKRFDLVNQTGIGGIGIWALGQDDGYTDFWDKIREKFSDCGSIPCSDTIYDKGGPNRNYYDNEDYTYTIAPQGATSVSLSFSSFSTESTFDLLYLYDGPSTASPLLGTFSGTTSPGTVNSTGSSLTIRHTSDNATVNSGWSAVWSCATSPPSNLSVAQNNCPSIGVVLNWQNSGNGWFVDVSDDPTFTNFWNKDVSNLTTIGCPGGFANITVPTNYLQFRPNTMYYWRIWNGSTHTNGTPFTTPVCASTDTLCAGTLDDSGGPSAAYGGNQDYTYTIAPVFAASVTLVFSSFDLENGFDSLYIHNGTSTASPLLGGYTGTASPGTVNGTSGALTLHFVSDPFVNNAGFSSSWTCVQNTGAEELAAAEKITVYPNPSEGRFKVEGLKLKVNSLCITDVYGKKVFELVMEDDERSIDITGAQSGIYFLKIISESGTLVKKIMKK